METLLTVLYLKGIFTGDFQEALGALLGDEASGLSPATISRLKSVWQAEYEGWKRRDLSQSRYAYVWADGIYFNVRGESDKQCILALTWGADRISKSPFLPRAGADQPLASTGVPRAARQREDAGRTRRSVEGGGHYWRYTQGIAVGCPLSPVLGAFVLSDLDVQLEHRGFCSVRFMDDVLVLTPTRWKLRRAVRLVNAALAALGLRKAPQKTFIGRITKGFSWLGYQLGLRGLRVVAATVERCAARIGRLYERGADAVRIGVYVQHWWRWVQAGLGQLVDGLWSLEGTGRGGDVVAAWRRIALDRDVHLRPVRIHDSRPDPGPLADHSLPDGRGARSQSLTQNKEMNVGK